MTAANTAQLRIMAQMGHMNFSELHNHSHWWRNSTGPRSSNRSTALVQRMKDMYPNAPLPDERRDWTNNEGLTEFTAKMRCHARRGRQKIKYSPNYGLDEWCQDNMGGTPETCECSSTPSEKELACAAIKGWERPRTYLMYGCSASTFIGNATRTILEEAGLCPFDFINSRFRYATSNSNIKVLLPELLQGTLESHQTPLLNVVPDDMDNVAGMTKMLHRNGTYMVHIFRENQLDEQICRTKGGWSTGGGDRQTYNLKPSGLMRRLREELDYRAKASTQMRELGFGTVELTAEALTEYEFDDSPRGWRRSLEAWHLLMNAWGVKLPPGALVRGLTKAGRPQPPHRSHATMIENFQAVRDELGRAGPPFDTWFRSDESRTTPVSESETASMPPSLKGSKGDAERSFAAHLRDEPFPRLGPLRSRTEADAPQSRGDVVRSAADRMAAAREAAQKARQRAASTARDAAAAHARADALTNGSLTGAARNVTVAPIARPAAAPGAAAQVQPTRNCYSIKAVAYNAWCASSCGLNNCPADLCACDDGDANDPHPSEASTKLRSSSSSSSSSHAQEASSPSHAHEASSHAHDASSTHAHEASSHWPNTSSRPHVHDTSSSSHAHNASSSSHARNASSSSHAHDASSTHAHDASSSTHAHDASSTHAHNASSTHAHEPSSSSHGHEASSSSSSFLQAAARRAKELMASKRKALQASGDGALQAS